jgi:phage gp45-like
MNPRYESERRRAAGQARKETKALISARVSTGDDGQGLAVAVGRESADGQREEDEAAVASGYGFYARPFDGAEVEAYTVFVGADGNHPVVIASRDPQIAALIKQQALEPGDTAMYNAGSCVVIRASGEIEARTRAGTAVALATKDDIENLRNWITSHTHTGVTTGGGVSGPPSLPAPPTPQGTQKFKAE